MMAYILYLSILNLKGFSVALLTTYLALFGIPSIWNITIPVVASRFGFIETWMVDSLYEGGLMICWIFLYLVESV